MGYSSISSTKNPSSSGGPAARGAAGALLGGAVKLAISSSRDTRVGLSARAGGTGIGAGLLVTFVLAGLGSLEHWVRRARRVVSATVRARVDTPSVDIRTALRAHGINVESERVFDHPEDRTFELKLSGPARQFEIATAALLGRDYIYGVHVD